jgi:hypothetical protein
LAFKAKNKRIKESAREGGFEDKFNFYGHLNAVDEVKDMEGLSLRNKIKDGFVLKLIKSCGEQALKKLNLYNLQYSGCSNETLFKTYI